MDADTEVEDHGTECKTPTVEKEEHDKVSQGAFKIRDLTLSPIVISNVTYQAVIRAKVCKIEDHKVNRRYHKLRKFIQS